MIASLIAVSVFPDLTAYFGGASVGTVVASSLILAFVILALCVGFFVTRSTQRQMNMLDDETRARRETERELDEVLCGAATGRAPSRQRKDPWAN